MRADIRLVLGDAAWKNWVSIDVDSDFLAPSDGWSATMVNPDLAQLAELELGQTMLLLVGDQVLARGYVEELDQRRSREGVTVSVTGRDLAGPLVDCGPVPGWGGADNTLEQLASRALSDLGIKAKVSAATAAKKKIKRPHPQPGETYWAILMRECKRTGLHPWMSRAGVLHLGGPDYTSAPVMEIRHPLSGGRSNVLDASYTRSLHGRASTLTVFAQLAEDDFGEDDTRLKGQANDAELLELGLKRPMVVDEGALFASAAKKRAAWEVGQRALEGHALTYEVAGIGPSATTLWDSNQQVTVEDEIWGCRGTWWVRRAQTQITREGGARTRLALHRPGLWLPEEG